MIFPEWFCGIDGFFCLFRLLSKTAQFSQTFRAMFALLPKIFRGMFAPQADVGSIVP